jgi:hypothetical protein
MNVPIEHRRSFAGVDAPVIRLNSEIRKPTTLYCKKVFDELA